MWKIQVPLPDDVHDDVVEAFCTLFRYPDKILDPTTQEVIDNPITPEDFVQDQLAYYIMEVTMNNIIQKRQTAVQEALNAEMEIRSANAIAWYDQYRKDNPEG